MSRTLTGWSFWGTRGSRGTEAPARQPGTHVNPLQRAGPIRVRAEIPSATRKRPFLNHATFSYMHREPLKSGLDRGEHVRKRQEPRSLLCWPCVTGGSCRLGCDEPHPVGTVQKELDKSGLSLGQGTHAVDSPSVPVAASPSSDPRRSAADTIPFIFGSSRSWNWPRPTAWHRQSRPVPMAGCTCG